MNCSYFKTITLCGGDTPGNMAGSVAYYVNTVCDVGKGFYWKHCGFSIRVEMNNQNVRLDI